MEKRQYVITERAHLMCPNMYFGIKAKIRSEYEYARVTATVEALADAHPFMKCVIAMEDTTGKLYYRYDEKIKNSILERTNAAQWSQDYQMLLKDGWNAFTSSLLKVVVYPKEGSCEILFIAHHLLADGRGLLGLICEFANCYVTKKKPVYAEEQLISSLHNLPKGSELSWVNKKIIHRINRNWEKENKRVSYEEYNQFEKKFIQMNPVKYVEETVEAVEVESLLTTCRKQGISLNDYLVADMMNKQRITRVVIAADIRNQISCYQEGALGNYATAMGIVSKSKSNNVIEKAINIARNKKLMLNDMSKKMMILACYLEMVPELIDAAAISTLGSFQSKAGKFVGGFLLGYKQRNGYSITNLGNVEHPYIEEAMFIPPASPANKITVGVLSVHNNMKKCSVCYEAGDASSIYRV